jgi:hypothetical protein
MYMITRIMLVSGHVVSGHATSIHIMKQTTKLHLLTKSLVFPALKGEATCNTFKVNKLLRHDIFIYIYILRSSSSKYPLSTFIR